METRTFSCSWGRATKWITGGVFCLIAFEIVLFSVLHFSNSEDSREASLPYAVVVSVGVAILGIPAFFAPRKYYMTPETMGVSRLGPDVVIPLVDVESVQVAKSADFSRTIRIFGSGGLYGSFGIFRNARMGTFRAYATQKEPLVIVKMKTGKSVVLSPDNPDAFVQAFGSFQEAK